MFKYLLCLGLLISCGLIIWNLFISLNSKHINEAYINKKSRTFKSLYIIVPALNEETTINKIIENLIESGQRIQQKLCYKIIFVDDDSDDQTFNILSRFSNHPNCVILKRSAPNARQGKGAALNFAANWINEHSHNINSQEIIVGVIDSDSYINYKLFDDVYYAFTHSNYNLIQVGIEILNRNSALTRMQAFEFTACNLLTQITRLNWGSAMASGNGQFMTLKMINDVKWSSSLLDDLEFSIKGILKGYTGGFISTSLVSQQGVIGYEALIKQRVRWCQGGIQCFYKYFNRITKSTNIKLKLKLDICAFLLLPFLGLIVLPLSILSLIIYIINFIKAPILLSIVLITFIIINIIVNLIVIRASNQYASFGFNKMKISKKISILLGSIWYSWLLSLVSYMAFYRNIKGNDNWNKTAHTKESRND